MREDEAINTMNLFDGVNETHRISKRALKDWVVSELPLYSRPSFYSSPRKRKKRGRYSLKSCAI